MSLGLDYPETLLLVHKLRSQMFGRSTAAVEFFQTRFFGSQILFGSGRWFRHFHAPRVRWQFWRQRFYFDSSHRKYSARFILFSCGRFFFFFGFVHTSRPSPPSPEHQFEISYSSRVSHHHFMECVGTLFLLYHADRRL